MKRMMLTVLLSGAALAGLSACDRSGDAPPRATQPGAPVPAPQRLNDPTVLARGRALFEQNCAVCHGGNAQGAVNWRVRSPDGTFPPPPLNGTGHAWHHPKQWLHQMIKYGSPPGQGHMPAWDTRLSDDDIDATIAWFQSQWPDAVYQAWAEMQRGQ